MVVEGKGEAADSSTEASELAEIERALAQLEKEEREQQLAAAVAEAQPKASGQKTVADKYPALEGVDLARGLPQKVLSKAAELIEAIARGEPPASAKLKPIKATDGRWFSARVGISYRLILTKDSEHGLRPSAVITREAFKPQNYI